MNYAKLYTLRSDGRYMGYWKDKDGKRHAIYDRDPKKLYDKIMKKESNPSKTFKDVAEAWIREHDVGFKTYATYNNALNQLYDFFNDKPIEEITPQEINAFLNEMKRKDYAKRTVQLRRDLMNMVFNYAIVHGDLKFNPISAVSIPRGLRKETREPPSPEAIQAVKDNKDIPFGNIPYTLLCTGMRKQELLGLRQEDIDREHKLIHIRRAVEFIGNQPSIKETKTKLSERTIPLLSILDIPTTPGYVFGEPDGSPMTKTQWQKRWKKYCNTIGFQFTAHQLRHAYASRLFELNVNPKDAQELLGHSNIGTTMNIYTHLSQSHKAEICEFLEKNFDSKFDNK